MSRFQPKRPDGRSYRDVAVDIFKGLPYGAVVSYDAIGRELDLKQRPLIQGAVRAANQVLLKIHQRGLKTIAGTGYRVLESREHMIEANGQQTKADKAMVRALRLYEGTNLSNMTDTERHLHHGQHVLAQAIYASHQHLDKRIRRIEDLLRGSKAENLDDD